MVELLPKITMILEIVAQFVLGLVVAASALAQILDKGKHLPKVEKFADKALKFINYLPTIGINPRTKQLEAQLKDMLKKDEPKS